MIKGQYISPFIDRHSVSPQPSRRHYNHHKDHFCHDWNHHLLRNYSLEQCPRHANILPIQVCIRSRVFMLVSMLLLTYCCRLSMRKLSPRHCAGLGANHISVSSKLFQLRRRRYFVGRGAGIRSAFYSLRYGVL